MQNVISLLIATMVGAALWERRYISSNSGRRTDAARPGPRSPLTAPSISVRSDYARVRC